MALGCAAGSGTPLSQTNFFPDLMAVYLRPRQMMAWPARFGIKVGPAAACAAPVIAVSITPSRPDIHRRRDNSSIATR